MSARPPAGRRLRRTWPQRLLIVFNVCAVLLALATAGAVAYGKKTVGQIQRVALTRDEIQPADELEPGDPQNFLIVGVDSDANLPIDDPVRDGRDKGREKVVGLRSDTIMLVRVDPRAGDARILSFPRDLWVDIPGHGHSRINSAMAYGEDNGPALLMATIKENFGIDVNHYVQVDFAAFKNVVELIDGVKVYLNAPVRDGYSGLYQPNAGCSDLDAGQALAYARSRHLQYQNDRGKWRSDPESDLSRIKRQQDFTRRVLRRAIEQGARNPATLARMVDTGTKHIVLDPFTTPQDLIDLSRAFHDFNPDDLITETLPVDYASRGGADVLDLRETEAEPLLASYRGTGTAVSEGLLPSAVSVRVVNGTGTLNQGADTTDRFDELGFKVSSPGADADTQPMATLIKYRPGDEAAAILVARYLPNDAVLTPDDTVGEITVVTGPDFTTVLDTPRAADDIATAPTTSSSTSTSTSTSSTTTIPGDEPFDDETTTTTSPDQVGYLPGSAPLGQSCG